MTEKVGALKILEKQLSEASDDRARIDITNSFCFDFIDFRQLNVYELANDSLIRSREIAYRKGEGFALMVLAHFHETIGEYEKGIEKYNMAKGIFTELNDPDGLAITLNFTAYSNWWMGNYDQALSQALRAIELVQDSSYRVGKAWCHYALGPFYFDLKDLDLSRKYYNTALELFTGIDHMYGAARCRTGLAGIHIAKDELDDAIVLLESSLEAYRVLGHVSGEARIVNDLGVIHKKRNRLSEAVECLERALQLRESIDYKQGIATTLAELGDVLTRAGRYEEAREKLERGLKLAIDIKTKPKVFQAHFLLSELYKKLQMPWEALAHLEKFYELKSEVLGEQASNKLKQVQTQYATEKSEKEAEIHRLKNVELRKAYEEIEENNKNIIDSINYAKRIQQAILPSEEEIRAALPHSFVFYKPKDVVSGDFYWFGQKNDLVFIAAVDCTGHGVPGAFMSMIGNTLLNEIVNEKQFVRPEDILFQLRESVIRSLRQTGAEGENKDGMDISLCVIDRKDNTLHFSGAHNPAWIIRGKNCFELKADKQPIGIYLDEHNPFSREQFALQQGDHLYLFTDGYADQFGGPKGKKFKYKQLQKLLLASIHLPMEEQKRILDDTLTGWKGMLEQVDDILVIGIRI